MKIFLVALDPEKEIETINEFFEPADSARVMPGVWFVRSKMTTSSEVADKLNVGKGETKVIVTADFYSGTAPGEVVEKLKIWKDEERS